MNAPDSQALITASLTALLHAQRAAFHAEQPVSPACRRYRLRRASAMLLRHADRFVEASRADFGYTRAPQIAQLYEVFFPMTALRHAERNFERWMRPQRRPGLFPFNLFGARAEIQYQPLGVVGVIAPWNAPLTLLMLPLASILAAGNRALLRPSDMTPHCMAAVADAVDEWFEPTEVAVAQGDRRVSEAFSTLPFDHLLFTGSTAVGRVVAQAAASKLTPVTLELGGKCPVFVLPDADLVDTARRLANGKLLNGGQACLGPDTVYAPSALIEPLLAGMDAEVRRQQPAGPGDPGGCGMFDERQYRRVCGLIDEARAAGATLRLLGAMPGGGERIDEQRRLAPVVLIDPPECLRVSTEELFGPVMVLRTCDDFDTALAELRTRDKPLGLYVFSRSRQAAQAVLDRSYSGGVTVNDIASHLSIPDLPFGGVGHSGMGAYGCGVEGFRRFSHARAVYHQAGPYALSRAVQPPFGGLFERVVGRGLDRLRKRYADVRPPAQP